MTPEGRLLRSACRYLDGLAPDVWYVKIRQGAYGNRGIPDILFCAHGAFGAIEVKSPDGETSPLQTYTLKCIERARGHAYVATSMDEVKMILKIACKARDRG